MIDELVTETTFDTKPALIGRAGDIPAGSDDLIVADPKLQAAAAAAERTDCLHLVRRFLAAFFGQSPYRTPDDALAAGFTINVRFSWGKN